MLYSAGMDIDPTKIINQPADERERPGDYRKPNRRPEGTEFSGPSSDSLEIDSAWLNWFLFEASVRLGYVNRSGQAQTSDSVHVVNVEALFDTFLDRFDELEQGSPE